MANSSFYGGGQQTSTPGGSTYGSGTSSDATSSFYGSNPAPTEITQAQDIIEAAQAANATATANLAAVQAAKSDVETLASTVATNTATSTTNATNAANSASAAATSAASIPHMTISTSLPSGGNDGDIWYVVN